ncbi:hypothetical protein [Mesorhizobium sp. LNJC403B00]|uniref:Bug family tripartite tricarboxylate transporter substrate binding protein n=1 Tax=unclassified Mesorhizobium TaxID=325217 RepID=UPI0003CE22CD|nr:hypothetical protein [Mesorhizobium sp. LNJC403B00]ESX92332.1 hypothetical protein X754_20300 [Mesorhizobium sp. LNJC403B00]
MKFFRVALAAITAAAIYLPSAASAGEIACATTYAGRRITLVVPNAAGGGYDTYARAFAPALASTTELDVRVVNMPAAGGFAALKRVTNAPSDELVLMIESVSDIISQGDIPAGVDNWINRLNPIGLIHIDPEAWIVRNDVDLQSAKHLVASVSSFEAGILPIVLTAHLLDIKVDVVSGYEGSGALMSALLRGEGDMTSNSLTTGLRSTAAGEAKVGLVLTEGPDPNAPGVAFLAGEGGLVWQRSQGLSKEKQEERLRLAIAVAKASATARGFFAPADMEQKSLGCLRDAVSAAVKSDGFKVALEAQKRPIEPRGADQTVIVINDMLSAFHEAEAYLKKHPELERDARATR